VSDPFDETAQLDATAIAAAVRRAELSPVEVVEATLARIRELDRDLNAHTVLFAEQALREARALEARGGDGDPLAGVPFTVKDVTWVKGAVATNGSAALTGFVAPADAVVVERMRAAGAILVGKTNNPELCLRGVTENDVYGVTRNPWDRGRTPGGSSGGAGAAVAAGMTPLALGSDGGGSIRIPASFCGVSGLKPTFGHVPDGPGFPGWPTLTVSGPIARSVRDLRLCIEVLSGPDPSDPASIVIGTSPPVDSPRIAFSADLGFAPVDPDVREAFGEAIETLGEAGCRLEEAAPMTGNPNGLWTRIAVAEGYASARELLEQRRDDLTADTVELLEGGARLSAADYLDAMAERRAFAAAWAAFFREYDALLTPAMQVTALPLGEKAPRSIEGRPVDPFFDDWCAFCLPANLTGQPAVSVPCGLDSTGLPIGLQIIAPWGRDELALDIASRWEAVAPPFPHPPIQQGVQLRWH
jgi:Asp-tRNA(Asn)/Glu-tRNA(Gln) amidotransferase A subunit family amidase